jgi:asparagine synthase (glutamine-hydrolysing)
MSLFACAVGVEAGQIPASFRAEVEASPYGCDRTMVWHTAPGFAGVVDASQQGTPCSIVQIGPLVAIGSARLDNRRDVARWARCQDDDASDLALVVRFVSSDDGARIGDLLGDFAFVLWDPRRRVLLAARDTFGVRKLFHARRPSGVLRFASRASLLAAGDRYDVEYLLCRVAQSASESTRTVFSGVGAVPPASVLRVRAGIARTTTYWSATDAQESRAPSADPAEQIDAFRSLLVDAVRLRVPDGAHTWSLLSGGLDSSSVVSVAQWLARHGAISSGLAGTITYTDSLGTSADEREFSDAVVQMYGLRNELVPHRFDAGALLRDPPLLDQPDRSFTIAVRDRAAARIVRQSGGRSLLTGEGGDALVGGTMFFFADWLVSGRARGAIREMAHRAALGRVSFWELAYQNAVIPLLPASLRQRLTRTSMGSVPPWIPFAAARRFGLARRSALEQAYGGRRGRKYEDALAATIDGIPSVMPLGPADDLLELRHPYLYRPLVELALRLPPEMCVRPHARKWILREAMRGILPEMVRTRVGKSGLDGLHLWLLTHEHVRYDRMLRDPMLAQLGVIDRAVLARVLDDVRNGRAGHDGWRDRINGTLEVEMWLQLRSGRWAAEDPQSTCTMQVNVARDARTLTGQLSGSFT